MKLRQMLKEKNHFLHGVINILLMEKKKLDSINSFSKASWKRNSFEMMREKIQKVLLYFALFVGLPFARLKRSFLHVTVSLVFHRSQR